MQNADLVVWIGAELTPWMDGAVDTLSADAKVLDAIDVHPVSADTVLRSQLDRSALDRLVARGLVQVAGVTPTDAAHVLGQHDAWNTDAAHLAVDLLARRRTAGGTVIAETPKDAAQLIVDTLVRRSAEAILDASLSHDGQTPGALSPLAQAALDGHKGAVRLNIGLDLPLIGLGASAPLFYPAIAASLRTDAVLPPHAGVANAVGAVAGHIRLTCQAVLTQPTDGVIRVHFPDGTQDFPRLSEARLAASERLRNHAASQAVTAGADAPELHEAWEEKSANVETRKVFVEGTLTITATGRPRIALPAA